MMTGHAMICALKQRFQKKKVLTGCGIQSLDLLTHAIRSKLERF